MDESDLDAQCSYLSAETLLEALVARPTLSEGHSDKRESSVFERRKQRSDALGRFVSPQVVRPQISALDLFPYKYSQLLYLATCSYSDVRSFSELLGTLIVFDADIASLSRASQLS